MNANLFDHFPWVRPWQKITVEHRDAYELELATELCPEHKLSGVKATAIARTCNGDDVLFILHGHVFPLVVVHLTFTGKLEPNPLWPTFRYFESMNGWVERCLNRDIVAFQGRLKSSA